MFMSYCIINRSCLKLRSHKNCQLYKSFHKIVKGFKKLGLGTPPLKKREKEMFTFVAGGELLEIHQKDD